MSKVSTKICCILVNFYSSKKIATLVSKLSTAPEISKIIIINNSPQEKIKFKSSLNHKKIDIIENWENLGFGSGVNQGFQRGLKLPVDRFLLLNPDIEISVSQISDLAQFPADIVSPVLTFLRHGRQIYDFGGKVNWTFGRTFHLESFDLKDGAQEEKTNPDYVSGACMMLSRRTIEKIGGFDEQFFMYFEDVDLCLRAKKSGLKISVDPNLVVQHQIDEHRYSGNLSKIKLSLVSNLKFINKHISPPNRPLAYSYWFILAVKSLF